MKSLILIPSYLWRNTLKRWFENLVSPLSKILIPFLLALLAILVLVFFVEIEAELRAQLKSGNSYSVYTVEQVLPNDHSNITPDQLIREQILWENKFGDKAIHFVRQPLLTLQWKNGYHVPVVIYTYLDEHLYGKETESDDIPEVLFLTKAKNKEAGIEDLTFQDDLIISAMRSDMPDYLFESIESAYVVAIPIEMGEAMLGRGYRISMHAELDSLESVESFVKDVKAYHKAEGRRLKVYSAVEVLKSIEKIQQIQKYVRVGVVLSCGIILAMILGTVAWLEFRQEVYLMALLRSFGTPRFMLVCHAFFENLILVVTGIGLSLWAWKPIYNMFQQRINGVNLRAAADINLPYTDVYIIMAAGLLGVMMAMIPIAIGLRKQTGLILQ